MFLSVFISYIDYYFKLFFFLCNSETLFPLNDRYKNKSQLAHQQPPSAKLTSIIRKQNEIEDMLSLRPFDLIKIEIIIAYTFQK